MPFLLIQGATAGVRIFRGEKEKTRLPPFFLVLFCFVSFYFLSSSCILTFNIAETLHEIKIQK